MEFDFLAIWNNKSLLAEGLATTLFISVVAIPLSILVGMIVALMRVSGNVFLRWIATTYVEIIRNTPFLIQIFMVFYALPFVGIRLSGLPTGVLCLAIYGAAYYSEIFRGGIESVPKGQFDASKALGLPYWFYMYRLIVPQLYKYVIPPGTNIALIMIKESSLLSMITVAELTYVAHDINGRTFSPVESFTAIAILYWLVSALFLVFADWLKAKTGRGDTEELTLVR